MSNVQQRRLEEREVFEDAGGIATEWGPAWEQPRGSNYWDERAWREYVRRRNAELRAAGSYTRVRSVPVEE